MFGEKFCEMKHNEATDGVSHFNYKSCQICFCHGDNITMFQYVCGTAKCTLERREERNWTKCTGYWYK